MKTITALLAVSLLASFAHSQNAEDELLLSLNDLGYQVSVEPEADILIDPDDGIPRRVRMFTVYIVIDRTPLAQYSDRSIEAAVVGAVNQLIRNLTYDGIRGCREVHP